ncbi:hypothetical protein GCM10007874_08030 [Labrys miyagiensis]|uniref:Addiction module killer protein n=1 Tax=Labrys miyagiensis TaxID=346912 RepID=A0ABQ6CBW6_9HYPH|nr:type II toxin-antitoxin system RelE/ParE family toxin [Labrys miyagiensis]GLS17788.1 hypothetical protein GCM10007874_08030 [Labrys miyagiensis]
MVDVLRTDEFNEWLGDLRDKQAVARIQTAIIDVSLGKFGKVKYLREGVSEIRIDHGPGYRVYLTRRGDLIVVLLCGGDKRTQSKDIDKAVRLAKEV